MTNTAFPDLGCKQRTKAVPPVPLGLMADVDAALEQKIFDLSQRQGVADIQHHRAADYLRRIVEITKGILHRRRLRNLTSRLKPIYSDNAGPTYTILLYLFFSGTSFPALLRHILATALSMSICERCVDNRAALPTPAIGRCRNPISRNRANVLWNCARRSIWREIAPLHSKPKRKVTTRALCARRREIHYQSGSASNFVYSNGTSK